MFHEILSAERDRQGLSDSELARRSNVPLMTLRDALAGNADPRFGNLRKILAGLGRSLTWLEREEKRLRNSGSSD